MNAHKTKPSTSDQCHPRRSFEKTSKVDHFLATLTEEIRERGYLKITLEGKGRPGTINKIDTRNGGMLGTAYYQCRKHLDGMNDFVGKYKLLKLI